MWWGRLRGTPIATTQTVEKGRSFINDYLNPSILLVPVARRKRTGVWESNAEDTNKMVQLLTGSSSYMAPGACVVGYATGHTNCDDPNC